MRLVKRSPHSQSGLLDMIFPLVFLNVLLYSPVQSDVQSFASVPENTNVQEGHTAILHCVVQNQAGQVQWSKNAVLLGYDRAIPGYPRHVMVSEDSSDSGVHNLVIQNATAEDEGDYECQVSPVEGHPALTAKAHLTVLFPASEIEINGYKNNSMVETKHSDSLDLTCEVRGGKPAPEIRWYRNNVMLRPDAVQVTYSTSEGNNGRETATSVLHLEPMPDDNRAMYTCESQRLEVDGTIYETPLLMTSVQMNVLFPPGRPVIDGYQEGRVIRKGYVLNVRCISRGGNPLAQLTWLKDGIDIDHSYISTDWESINELRHEVDSSDNGAKYACRARSIAALEDFEASFTLNVLYPPSKVTIEAPETAKTGDVVTVTCTTDASNPASEISWWTVHGGIVSPPHTIIEDSKGGWITKSQLTVNITEQEIKEKIVSCYATNKALGETVTATVRIDILYPPDQPIILGYSEGTAITAGSLQRLTCVSQRGNPLPTLKWFKDSKEIEKATSTVNGNMVSSYITVIVTQSDNGARYRCESSNAAISEPLETSVALTVHFPPSNVKIKVKPKKPKAGHKVTLTCESASSNPPSVITWWREGKEIGDASSSRSNSDNGGESTKSTLVLNATYDDNGSTFVCKATNDAVQQSVHDAVVLKLLYKPVFSESDPITSEVKEGESFILNLNARANPDDVTYAWTKDNDTFSEGPFLNITSVSRNDAGRYVLQAKNDVGSSKITLILKVLFAAVIVRDESEAGAGDGDTESGKVYVIAEPDSSPQLQCTAEGYPLDENALSWKRDSFDMAERTKTTSTLLGDNHVQRRTSTLTVMQVKKEDSGEFSCVANNGVGDADTYKVTLLVKHAPTIVDAEDYSLVSSNRNVETKLQCKAAGVPEVEFKWSLQGGIIPDDDHTSYSKKRIDHMIWESTLSIKDVGIKDFGEYKCIARNEVGFDTAKIILEADSAPDPPVILRVVNATQEALHLVWVPGFDGGHQQAYRIRFRRLDSPNFKYIDVYPENSTSMWLTGLDTNVTYELAMMSMNQVGPSPYTTDIVKVRTLGPSESYGEPEEEVPEIDNAMLRLLVSSACVMFLFLLLFNVFLLYAYCKRKRRKSKFSSGYVSSAFSESSDLSSVARTSEEITLSDVSDRQTTPTTATQSATSGTTAFLSVPSTIESTEETEYTHEDFSEDLDVSTVSEQEKFYAPTHRMVSFV